MWFATGRSRRAGRNEGHLIGDTILRPPKIGGSAFASDKLILGAQFLPISRGFNVDFCFARRFARMLHAPPIKPQAAAMISPDDKRAIPRKPRSRKNLGERRYRASHVFTGSPRIRNVTGVLSAEVTLFAFFPTSSAI
jgi:hypothetical protein